jgi:hypothetical protein
MGELQGISAVYYDIYNLGYLTHHTCLLVTHHTDSSMN